MNIVQVVVRTVVTTVDLLIALIVLRDEKNPEPAKKILTGVVLLNIMGVWI